MLETLLQADAVAPLAFQDIRLSVLQLVAAIHVPSINARRTDNKEKGAFSPFLSQQFPRPIANQKN